MPRSPAPILCTRNWSASGKFHNLWAYPRTGPLYTMSAMSAGTRFTIAIFLHLVGMVGLFMGYGLEWVASSLLRRSTNAEQVRAWLRIYRLSLPISGAGLLLLILSGVYFASIFDSMTEGWLLSSLLATVFAFGIGFVFILPRVRMLRAVLPEGNTPLSEAGRGVCPRSRDPHTNPSAVSAHARYPLFNDYQARPCHLAFYLARRHRGGPDLRRNGVDGTP